MSEAEAASRAYFYCLFGVVSIFMVLAIIFRKKPVGGSYREDIIETDKIRRLW